MFSAEEIIDFAVQIERNGERLCREAARTKIDAELAALLEWMADQELQHLRWLSGLRSQTRIRMRDPLLEEFGRSLLSEIIGDQSFSLQQADFSRLQDLEELLALLIEFEQDTLVFYEMLQAAVEDQPSLSLLEKVIAEENQHVSRIKDQLEKIRMLE